MATYDPRDIYGPRICLSPQDIPQPCLDPACPVHGRRREPLREPLPGPAPVPPAGTKPISLRERALLDSPSIASQMPVEFPNGARFLEVTANCRPCGRIIPADLFRGIITRHSAHLITLDACGVCPSCRIATPFFYRLHDDMRITGPTDHGWRTWRPNPSWWERLPPWLRRHRQ